MRKFRKKWWGAFSLGYERNCEICQTNLLGPHGSGSHGVVSLHWGGNPPNPRLHLHTGTRLTSGANRQILKYQI
jgi:hypothetical protein